MTDNILYKQFSRRGFITGTGLLMGSTALAGCVTGNLENTTSQQARQNYDNSNYSLFYKGSEQNPEVVVIDKKGGLEMKADSGWKKASSEQAYGMFNSALDETTPKRLVVKDSEKETTTYEGLLFELDANSGKTYSLSPNVEKGTFTVREYTRISGGGGAGSSGGSGGAGGGGGGGSGGGGGGACLLNNSLVLTNDNKLIKIQDLNIGDEVKSFNIETNNLVKTKITKIVKNHPRDFFYIINGNLSITNDHPVLVLRNDSLKWIRVEDLEVGDMIKSIEEFVKIENKVKVNKQALTVYLETESGSFIAKAGEEFYVVKANYVFVKQKLEEPVLIGA